MIEIPISRAGQVIAHALIDDEDAHLAEKGWWLNNTGYPSRREGPATARTSTSLHREVMGLVHGDKREVDHINHNRLDCRRANLRIVTRQQNAQNLAPTNPKSKSGLRGVWWHKQGRKWCADVIHNGRKHYLGLFSDKFEAAAAADRKRQELGFCGSVPIG